MNLPKFSNKQKAIDKALWLNFCNRVSGKQYVVIKTSETEYLVFPKDKLSNTEKLESIPTSYSKMGYQHIEQISTSAFPLEHWETIKGIFSVVGGEVLRYILVMEIPLERFVRYELFARGFDENHEWCGFEKARKIWLKK